MLSNSYALEQLIARRREDLLREAEQARLARLAAPGRGALLSHFTPRAMVAGTLRGLADRLEPTAAQVREQRARLVYRS